MTIQKKIQYAFALIFMSVSQALAWEPAFVQIQTVKGSVTYKEVLGTQATQWKVAKVGKKLKTPFVIQTASNALIGLQTTNGSELEIGEKSVVRFENSASDLLKGTQDRLMVSKGILNFKIQKLLNDSSSFEMNTPKVTAAVRGTQGGIEVGEDATQMYLDEGVLALIDPLNEEHKDEIRGLELLFVGEQWEKSKSSSHDDLKNLVVKKRKDLNLGITNQKIRENSKRLSPKLQALLNKKLTDMSSAELKDLELEKAKLKEDRALLRERIKSQILEKNGTLPSAP